MTEFSRRKFLSTLCYYFGLPLISGLEHLAIEDSFPNINNQVETTSKYSPLSHEQAVILVDIAINQLGNHPYSMAEGRHCSSFIGLILREMGYPTHRFINFDNNQQLNINDNQAVTGTFPDSNTVAQMERFQSLNTALNTNLINYDLSIAHVATSLSNTPPGSLFYFRLEGASHNGYNTYYHVAVCLGQDENKIEFADFGPGMNGPQRNRSFEQVAIGVYGRRVYQQELSSTTNSSNNVTTVDAHQLLWEWQQTIEYRTKFN